MMNRMKIPAICFIIQSWLGRFKFWFDVQVHVLFIKIHEMDTFMDHFRSYSMVSAFLTTISAEPISKGEVVTS